MEPKKSNKLVIVAVVLVMGGFAVIFCGGVLAAIAVPSFVRYTHQAKAAEGNMIARQMALYAKTAYVETCTFPEALPPSTDLAECCGGLKCAPAARLPEIWTGNIGQLWDPSYFSYSAVPSGSDKLTIIAEADFTCGGPRHTVTVEVQGTKVGETCDATAGSPLITNEFE